MSKSVCVFCAASDNVDPAYLEAARETGRLLAERGFSLVYGGGCVGLMGAAAVSAHAHGGRVIGVIPEVLVEREVAYHESDELIVTKTMNERKDVMTARSDAFLTLPGGFGTMDELFEVIALKQLGFHQQPICLVNVNGYFDGLLRLFAQIERERFAPSRQRDYCRVFDDPGQAIGYLADVWSGV